ncbi:methyl-accepting chemotaxis protein [Selenomonas sp. TAMA-11512]|uniref:methyl-accepting chemotaxis protein n=1 Tax=Selenomonas sp. TAMA-11512 TaxID=3095337 RepID=UPI00308A9D08|nr:methyl-accepting chemotaxis protein [Selenomonas sp. TAMA-11512]
MTVSKKIGACFIALIVIFTAFGVFTNYSGGLLHRSTSDVKDWMDGLINTASIEEAANVARNLEIMRILADDPTRQAQLASEMQQARQKVDGLYRDYLNLIKGMYYANEADRTRDLAMVQNEYDLWNAYIASGQEAGDLLANGERDSAIHLIDGASNEAYSAFIEAVEKDSAQSIKMAEETKARSDAEYDMIFTVTVVSIIVVILLTVACAFYLYQAITRGVNDVLTGLKTLAKGDLTVKIRHDSNDEFGQMANEFNQTVRNIANMVMQAQKTAESVNESSEVLNNTAEQSAQAVQNVAESITEVAGAAAEQNDFIGETKAQVDAFMKGIEEASDILNQVADKVNTTSQRAQDGNELVQSTVTQMNTIADGVQNAAEVVSTLGKRSKEIGNIVEVITGISGQTNLLALNAAIEAARAGEQGRGFAVVAEEVRKLAEESGNASQQIATLITAIQQETEKAVEAMSAGHEQAEQGRENVTSTGEGFSEILGMIEAIHEEMAVIRKTIADLAGRAEKISDATNNINESTGRISGQSENVSAATEEQAAGMEEIAASSRGLADMSVELKQIIGKFRT